MLDRPQNSKSKLISEQAADWLLRFGDGGLSVGDRQGYVRWLKSSPDHVREVLEVANLEELLRSSDLSDLEPPGDSSGESKGESSIVDFTPSNDPKETPSDQRRRSPWHHWKFAASACLARIEFAGRAISKFVGIRG